MEGQNFWKEVKFFLGRMRCDINIYASLNFIKPKLMTEPGKSFRERPFPKVLRSLFWQSTSGGCIWLLVILFS